MLMEGWFKMHRKFQESAIFQEAHRFRLAMYCIANANYAPKTWVIPGTRIVVDVPRGGFVTGRHKLHSALYPQKRCGDPSESSLWRILSLLAEIGFVKLKNLNSRATLVTLCNYETYQSGGGDICPGPDPKLTQTCPELEHNVRSKESKEVIPKAKPRKCNSRKACEVPEADRYLDFPASDGTFWLTHKQKDELQAHWKDVDVPDALKAAKGWCLTAGDKQKSCADMYQFIGGWITRGVNNKTIKLRPASKCPSFDELLNPGSGARA